MSENYTPRLKTRYREEIRKTLNDEFKYDNVMQIPGVTKVVVNMGVGEAARDSKVINGALEDLTAITGQKPQLRRAKSPSRTSSSVRACLSVHALPCVATVCGSSWTAC